MGEAVSGRPILYSIYDLSIAPITFDVMNAFVFANVWTERVGFGGYHVVFVMGPGNGFRNLTPKDNSLDVAEKMWRLRHVLMSHAAIARRCVGVSLIQQRSELPRLLKGLHPKQVIPSGYTLEEPKGWFMLPHLFRANPTATELDVFAPPEAALRKVDRWLQAHAPNGRPVVMTLRSAEVEAARNSRVEEWMAAAKVIGDQGYDPIVIPDTDLVTSGRDAEVFDGVRTFPLGAIDLELRLALYRRAHLNMADNGGPAFLNFFMGGATMLCFLPVDKLPAVVVNQGGLDRMAVLLGVRAGESFPHATPTCRFVWKPDRCDNILFEFEQARAALEGGPGNGPTSLHNIAGETS